MLETRSAECCTLGGAFRVAVPIPLQQFSPLLHVHLDENLAYWQLDGYDAPRIRGLSDHGWVRGLSDHGCGLWRLSQLREASLCEQPHAHEHVGRTDDELDLRLDAGGALNVRVGSGRTPGKYISNYVFSGVLSC